MTRDPAVSGRIATDRGLSGLGLIMQLVGGVTTAVAAAYLAMFLIALLEAGSMGGDGGVLLWFLVVLVASVARSIAHRNAGDRLLFDGEGTPASALSRYLVLSMIQTAVVCVALLANHARAEWLLAVVLVLGAWPLALALIARPMVAELGDRAPMAVDGGLDGASILLLVLGAIGVGLGAIMLLGWLEVPAASKWKNVGLALFGSGVLLTIRSVLHLRAGLRGTTGDDVAQTFEAAERYAGFGMIAGLVAGGLLFVAMVGELPSGRPMATMVVLVMGVMVAWMLVVWPSAVRRFSRHRQLAALDGNLPLRARARDRGLPALGWLLLAFGAYSLATGLSAALLGGGTPGAQGGGDNPVAALGGALGDTSRSSIWLGIGVAALQTWAGAELVRMRPGYRTAGMAYGLAATGVALYTYLPVLGALTRQSAGVVANPLGIASFATVATALVIPVATLVLVQRKLVDPDAVADTFT